MICFRDSARRSAIFHGSILNVTGSISTNTGRAPNRHTASAVAKNVYDGKITSSPGPILQSHQCQQQRIAAGSAGDGMLGAGVGRDASFQLLAIWAENEPPGIANAIDGRADRVAQRLILPAHIQKRHGEQRVRRSGIVRRRDFAGRSIHGSTLAVADMNCGALAQCR